MLNRLQYSPTTQGFQASLEGIDVIHSLGGEKYIYIYIYIYLLPHPPHQMNGP